MLRLFAIYRLIIEEKMDEMNYYTVAFLEIMYEE